MGCSARFDDLQHVRPEELRTTSNTIELQAWQTKVARAARIRTKPVPLICPKYSFSGAPWYLQFVSTVRKLSVLKAFEGMDYLLPTISKDFAGLIPRPSGGDRALRWLKDALRRRGVAQEHVAPLTWHSFRVFIPDCAFQLGVPRSERQYLGNWMTESTADVYTREKRNVVTAIWTKVADKVNSLKMTLGRERREDLNHGDWDDPVAEVVDADERHQGSPPRSARRSMADTPPVGEGTPQSDQVTPGTTDSWDIVEEADKGADQDYSYQVISSNTVRRGPEKQFRVHLLTVEGFCLGWRPKSTQMTVLTPGEYWANPTGYGKCTRCFAKGDLPKSWFVSRHGTVEGKDIPDLEVDTESSATSGSETDDSVDTQSEADAVPLPKVLPVESI